MTLKLLSQFAPKRFTLNFIFLFFFCSLFSMPNNSQAMQLPTNNNFLNNLYRINGQGLSVSQSVNSATSMAAVAKA